jgi:hypothetical protein
MAGLQPGTLGKMLDLGRWRIDRPLVGGLDYRTRSMNIDQGRMDDRHIPARSSSLSDWVFRQALW